VWFGEASFSCLIRSPDACPARPARAVSGADRAPVLHTRPMRRWVCVLVLLFGFTSESYAWTVRARPAVPVERDLASFEPSDRGTVATGDWWQRG
jgi:hypothetical protein